MEIREADGSWRTGRITAWWRPNAASAEEWCELRESGVPGTRWTRYDAARIAVLPIEGT